MSNHTSVKYVQQHSPGQIIWKPILEFTVMSNHTSVKYVHLHSPRQVIWKPIQEFTAGKKPYKCEVCSASFTKAINLKTHSRDHIGDHNSLKECQQHLPGHETWTNIREFKKCGGKTLQLQRYLIWTWTRRCNSKFDHTVAPLY